MKRPSAPTVGGAQPATAATAIAIISGFRDAVIDTAEHYGTRLQAIAEHRSQSSPFEGLPED